MKSFLLNLKQWRYLAASIIFSFLNFTGHTQCVAAAFPAPASILANVPEAANFNLVYSLPIPSANQAWATQADVPYAVNNVDALAGYAFTRVAYYLKLESTFLGVQWVWVSMNAFTNELGRIGIPTGDILYQQLASNMNVLNNAGVNRTGIAGNLEFWSSTYNPDNAAGVLNASNSIFDFGDAPVTGPDKFGSFQVHDFNNSETVLAYNGWAFPGFSADDLGIGNFAFGANPDWTFASNANFYDVKELYVFASKPPYQPACNSTTLELDANGNATLTTAAVTNEIVGQCGIESIALSKTNFTCANLGSNTVTISFSVNGVQSTCNSAVIVKDMIKPALQVQGTSLTLGCDPTAAAIEAALGTATATDNCGTPTLESTTTIVTANGNNREQTRTWTATDASNNMVTGYRMVTWTTNCTVLTPHIFSSDVSCKEFNNGASPLLNVCYKAEDQKVKKVSPKTFYYYTNVTAPASLGLFNILTIDVVQTKSCAAFKLYEIQGHQVRAFDSKCKLIANGKEVANGQAKIVIIGATPGKVYSIAVSYETKSLKGSTYSGNTAPVCSNSFVTKISTGLFGMSTVVPFSQATILAKPDCYKNNDDDDDDDDDDDRRSKSMLITKANTPSEILAAVAFPNPSAGYFSINLTTTKTIPVTVTVTDVLGSRVYLSNRLTPNGILKIGDNWKPGTYFCQLIQGEEIKMIKLIKQ